MKNASLVLASMGDPPIRSGSRIRPTGRPMMAARDGMERLKQDGTVFRGRSTFHRLIRQARRRADGRRPWRGARVPRRGWGLRLGGGVQAGEQAEAVRRPQWGMGGEVGAVSRGCVGGMTAPEDGKRGRYIIGKFSASGGFRQGSVSPRTPCRTRPKPCRTGPHGSAADALPDPDGEEPRPETSAPHAFGWRTEPCFRSSSFSVGVGLSGKRRHSHGPRDQTSGGAAAAHDRATARVPSMTVSPGRPR